MLKTKKKKKKQLEEWWIILGKNEGKKTTVKELILHFLMYNKTLKNPFFLFVYLFVGVVSR